MTEDGSREVGRLAVERGMISASQLRMALEELERREAAGRLCSLGELLLERGLLSRLQLDELASAAGGARRRLGGYELIRNLGQGGMGSVLLARQVSMDRLVALKVLRPVLAADRDFVARFMREARLAGKLDHPNIVRAIDVGEAEGRFYLAMEYVEGKSVQDLMAEGRGLPERRALEITLQVARALECAHRHGIIHRDIKPANILLDARGTAKLADLGLAKQVGGETRLTQTGVTMGSPDYISPEQAGGGGEVDVRGDIYSLGVTLFHMVTGRTPFEGPSAIAVMTKHVTERVPWVREVSGSVSEGCARLIARMTVREPELRYQTPQELVADIELVLAGGTPKPLAPLASTDPTMLVARAAGASAAKRPSPPPAAPPAPAGASRLRRWLVNGLAVLGALFLLLIVVGILRGGRNRRDGQPGPGPESGAPVSVGPGPVAEEPVGSVAAAVPADAVLLGVAAGRARWRELLAQSTLGAIGREPQVEPFAAPLLEEFERRLSAFGMRLSRDTGGLLGPKVVDELLAGEFGVALLEPRPDRKGADGLPEPVVLLLARPAGGAADFERLERALEEKVSKPGPDRPPAAVARSEHRGAEVRVFTAGEAGLAVTFCRGVAVISPDREAVLQAIDCLKGSAPVMASEATKELPRERLLSAAVSLPKLRRLNESRGEGAEFWRSLRALGADCVRRAEYSLELEAPLFHERLIIETGRPEGIFGALASGQPLGRDAAEGVPGEAVLFAAASARPGDLLAALRGTSEALAGAGNREPARQLKIFEERLRRGGLALDDLAKALGGEVSAFLTPPDRKDPWALGIIAAVRDRGPVKDLATAVGRGRFADALETEIRTGQPKRPLESAELYEARVAMAMRRHADEIRSWRLPEPASMPGGEFYPLPSPPGSAPAAVALLTDRALFGSKDVVIRKVARILDLKPGGRLAESGVYTGAVRRLPPEPCVLVWSDAPRLYDFEHLLLASLVASTPALKLDPAKMPPAKAVSRHLRPEAAALYAGPERFRLESLVNVPSGLVLLGAVIWQGPEDGKADPAPADPAKPVR